MNSSRALRVTVSSSARLSPRWGTRTCTFEPRSMRQPLLVRSRRPRARRARAPAWARPAADRRRTGPRGCGRRGRPGVSSSTLSTHEALAPDDPAPADVEHLHRRLQLVVGEADHVEVLVACRPPSAAARSPAAPRPAGRAGGPPSRTRVSVAASRISASRRLTIGVGVTVEEVAQLVDELAVRHLVDLADARPASTSRCGTAGTAGRAAGAALNFAGLHVRIGNDAAARRACRGWRRRGRTARSSGCPCACGRASPAPAATARRR